VTQRHDRGGEQTGRLGYAFAALSILTSLTLGVATLRVDLHPDPDPAATPQPSVAIEETDPGIGSDTPKTPNAPGYDPKQANLVAAEDRRVFNIVGQVLPGTPPHELTSPNAPPTLVLPSRTTPYTLANLVSAGAVLTQPGGLLVVRNVLVAPGARLQITAPNGQLRLSSTPTGFTSLVAFKATIDLSGADHAPLTVTSWNPVDNAPDTDETDGRAYLRVIGGRMDLNDVNTVDLGFWSGRTGGVAWTGSASAPSDGTATNVNFSGNHYGVFLSRSTGVLINGAQVSKSTMDGVSVHTGAQGTQLWRVTTNDCGRNGVAVSAGAQDTSLRAVTATGSARNGIYLDGTPPAFGPNASGSTTQASSGFIVDGSTARGNSEHGILITSADNVVLTNNTVAANRDGVIVRGVARGVVLRANHISSPGGFAVAIRAGAKDAVVDQNVISNALTAVQVNDSVAVVTGNEIDGMTLHAVSLIGRSSGSSVKDNRLDGRGPSAIDTNRLAFGGVITESGNDDANWTVDHDDVQFVSNFVRKHPLILLWFLTLMFPLAARVLYRRRNNRALGTHPYGPALLGSATGPVAAPITPRPGAPAPPCPRRPRPTIISPTDPAHPAHPSYTGPRSAVPPPRPSAERPQPTPRHAPAGQPSTPPPGAAHPRPAGPPTPDESTPTQHPEPDGGTRITVVSPS
jgi:parallel beta-helix repeat protein